MFKQIWMTTCEMKMNQLIFLAHAMSSDLGLAPVTFSIIASNIGQKLIASNT